MLTGRNEDNDRMLPFRKIMEYATKKKKNIAAPNIPGMITYQNVTPKNRTETVDKRFSETNPSEERLKINAKGRLKKNAKTTECSTPTNNGLF